LEETPVIYNIKVSTELCKSFSTTNCIESIMFQAGRYTRRVSHWRNGEYIRRWVASGLLEVEPYLRKVNGCRYMNLFRNRIKERPGRQQQEQSEDMNEKELVQVGS